MADLDEELVRHHPAAFGWALACCRWDRGVAEDVVQSAYLKVLDGRAKYGGQSEFRGFLFGVIRRTADEERRRRAVRAVLTLAAFRGAETSIDATGANAIVRDEQSRTLLVALDRLPTRQREVLHLVFYQDMSIAAASEVLGISIGSARVHYERGKARLRELLGAEEK